MNFNPDPLEQLPAEIEHAEKKEVLCQVQSISADSVDLSQPPKDRHHPEGGLPAGSTLAKKINSQPKARNSQRLRSMTSLIKRAASVTLTDYQRTNKTYKVISAVDRFYHFAAEPSVRQTQGGDKWIWRSARAPLPQGSYYDTEDKEFPVLVSNSNVYYGMDVPPAALMLYKELATQGLPASECNEITKQLSVLVEDWFGSLHNAAHARVTNSGYNANVLALSMMIQKEKSIVLMDSNSHNSIIVAARTCSAKLIKRYKHDDLADMESMLKTCRLQNGPEAHIIVITEGLFSMEGSCPDLPGIADLKLKYNFELYMDECHSILTLGSNGLGVYEHFQDKGYFFPQGDPIDVRTWGTGKSFGNFGGAVSCIAKYKASLDARYKELVEEGMEPMLLPSLVSCLLHKYTYSLAHPKLARLSHMATHARRELKRAGLYVYGDDGIPLIPIHVGMAYHSARFMKVALKHGLVIPHITAPAVEHDSARMRFCLSANFENTDIDRAIELVIEVAVIEKIISKTQAESAARDRKSYAYSGPTTSPEDHASIWREAIVKVRTILDSVLCRARPEQYIILNPNIAATVSATMDRWLLGSGSARWIGGTARPHVDLEYYLRGLIGVEEALVFGEHRAAQLSLSRALARPLYKCRRHYHICPARGAQALLDGRQSASRHPSLQFLTYEKIQEIPCLLDTLCAADPSSWAKHVTIFIILTRDEYLHDNQNLRSLLTALDLLTKGRALKATVVINDEMFGVAVPNVLTKSDNLVTNRSTSRLGIITELVNDGWFESKQKIQIAMYGSFYRTFALPGGFLAGTKQLVDEMRWACVSYMFSTAPPPYLATLTQCKLESLVA
ncbi:hypothetical protein KCU83_g4757, partial [Aureobasidium melanogenum]